MCYKLELCFELKAKYGYIFTKKKDEKEKSNTKETKNQNPLQSVHYHLESDLQICDNLGE